MGDRLGVMGNYVVPDFVSIGVRLFPANTLIALQRLQSLAFGCGTFAYAKDQASSPHNGLLKEKPIPRSNDSYLGFLGKG